jgi:hypothetical protein
MYGFDAILMDLELIFADKLPDIKYVISIYGKILINSFAVQDEFMRQIGRAVYIGFVQKFSNYLNTLIIRR